MTEKAVIIKCPMCKEPVAITREALLGWDDKSYFPICSSKVCGRGLHFDDLPKRKLVELLRMIATDPTPCNGSEDSPEKEKETEEE